MATLFVSDIDGTLAHDGRIDAASVDRVRAAIGRGVPFTCASARSWATAQAILADLDLRLPLILHNGAAMVDPAAGSLVASRPLGPRDVRPVIDQFRQARLAPLVSVFDSKESIAWVEKDEDAYVRAFWSSRVGDPRSAPMARHEDLPLTDVLCVTALGSKRRLREVANSLLGQDVDVSLRQSSLGIAIWWLEVKAAGASKGAAVLELARDIGAKRIVAFGNDTNDVPLFHVASESYTVGLVPRELRRSATGRIESSGSRSVGEWLEAHA